MKERVTEELSYSEGSDHLAQAESGGTVFRGALCWPVVLELVVISFLRYSQHTAECPLHPGLFVGLFSLDIVTLSCSRLLCVVFIHYNIKKNTTTMKNSFK